MLFDDEEFDFPIVSCPGFPSFRAHGWDPRYPPPEIKQLRDRSFEMLSCDSVRHSDHAIVPSKYATLFVTTGDPLETPSNVTAAWVQGRVGSGSSRRLEQPARQAL
ncbi:MAG: hypothetical protein O2820_03870 [Planctomycetota bacterium]|nr:hypothetical protein [Planctomycetota bacterium]MDA1248340.1 hypothetical protein [Planctomycetota bacterium]